jgi:hypothetical protein
MSLKKQFVKLNAAAQSLARRLVYGPEKEYELEQSLPMTVNRSNEKPAIQFAADISQHSVGICYRGEKST